MNYWEIQISYADGRFASYRCNDRNHCDEVWDEQRRLHIGESLYGVIGYREKTDEAGIVQFRHVSTRSANFAGF
jgi:hypothetical protein